MNTRENPTANQKPNEYFDDSSFKTLYGGVVITWVSTSAIVDVFGSGTDPKMIGFIVALIVAMVGFFLKEDRSVKKFVITPFNGLLIYLTIMGGTSFLPAPDPGVEIENHQSSEQASEISSRMQTNRSAFLTNWNPDRDLMNTATELERQNIELRNETTELRHVNTELLEKVEITRESIREMQISPEIQESLINQLDTRNLQMINRFNHPEINPQMEQ